MKINCRIQSRCIKRRCTHLTINKNATRMMTSLVFSYKNYDVQKRGSTFSLGLNAAKNTHSIKNALTKSCSKLNFVQKSPRTHTLISPPSGVELGGSKDSHLCQIIMYKNGKVDSVWGSTLPKIRIASKKALNKSYAKLNFV